MLLAAKTTRKTRRKRSNFCPVRCDGKVSTRSGVRGTRSQHHSEFWEETGRIQILNCVRTRTMSKPMVYQNGAILCVCLTEMVELVLLARKFVLFSEKAFRPPSSV